MTINCYNYGKPVPEKPVPCPHCRAHVIRFEKDKLYHVASWFNGGTNMMRDELSFV